MAGMRVLGILDRAYRGAVEAQFFDALYGVLDIKESLGEVDMVLRGGAVTLAVAEKVYEPALEFRGYRVDTLPDYRASVRALVAEGVRITVDEPDLRTIGFAPGDLLPGVEAADTNALAATTWPSYDAVWFV